LRRKVDVVQSALARVPMVVGLLRPTILLPVEIVTGLSPGHLEAILAHELAHIRRHDFAVNLLQSVVESLFFYHPAVWLLSQRLRAERENCCDDLAAAQVGSRADYGRALLALDEVRDRSPALALGATGDSLLRRIQRLKGDHGRQDSRTRALAAMVASV